MAFDDKMRVSFYIRIIIFRELTFQTYENSTGVKVGIAWLSQLCETQVSQQIEDDGSYEWVSGTGVSSITRDEWKVVAHEVGHGFGNFISQLYTNLHFILT